jgi:hypothetical protein
MSPEDLIGHLLGLLDADEHRRIQEQLDADNAVRVMFETLNERVAVLGVDRTPGEAPQGLAIRTCERVRVFLQSAPPKP